MSLAEFTGFRVERSKTILVAAGIISCSISSFFGPSSLLHTLIPVALVAITTRSIEAGDQTYSDGIGTGRENHRNGSGCRLRRACGNIAPPPGEAGRWGDRPLVNVG